jgi:prepilin signal peptidase PulO-like enzyme (type II secretory pathway)
MNFFMFRLYFLFLTFIFGLAIGSFLNVLIYRLPKSLSISGRSFCPKCKKKITWRDNIPLLSFIFLGGRCRYCHSPISWQYPLVELVTALLTTWVVYNKLVYYTQVVPVFFTLFICWVLIAIFVTDLKERIIPDQIVYPAILFSLLFILIYRAPEYKQYLASGILAAGFFWLLYLITRGKGMGLGDVKLAGMMGLVLGFPQIVVALYIAFLTGAALGVILMLIGKKKPKSQIAFGPFLALGTLISLFYGEIIWQKLIGALL